MKNPLLVREKTPPFHRIKTKHILPAINSVLASNHERLKELLRKNKTYTWQNLMEPFLDDEEQLSYIWSIVRHLHMVADSPALRKVYEACLAKVTSYYSALGQNQKLYKAILTIKEDQNFSKLNAAEKKIISNMLRDFHLAGADLPKNKQREVRALQKKLSNLQTKFSNNVLDSTNAWRKIIADQQELSGIPEYIVKAAASNAAKQKLKGFLVTLHAPFYEAVLTYANKKKLRQEMYVAYVTRALANDGLVSEILQVRSKLAQLLGFGNYAELSLATKMFKEPKQVLDFLNDISKKALPKARLELAELEEFAREKFKVKKLFPWDIAYYREKMRQQKYALSQDELRQYFPVDQVLSGIQKLVEKLFSVKILPLNKVSVWHEDVKCFQLLNRQQKCMGKLYLDLYVRSSKQGGAWMDSCQTRYKLQSGSVQIPIAYLVCNFAPPIAGKPSLLTFDEVTTLFHEFGHCLQHLLTTVDYAPVSGINGVLWDAVELASQFMENWCNEKKILETISRHHITKKPLPLSLQKKIHKAKNMQSGLQTMRQLEFALFDFLLHSKNSGFAPKQVQSLLNTVRSKVNILPKYAGNRFQNSFLHIFAGEYAAGYYSYKWSEVMSSDVFAIFQKRGLFNKKVAEDFLKNILAVGGVIEPLDAFKNFAGREPKIDALLKADGIVVNAEYKTQE
ncbi:MAG: M3 family metallopeptidase [Gammaproteobacteria bacterium]